MEEPRNMLSERSGATGRMSPTSQGTPEAPEPGREAWNWFSLTIPHNPQKEPTLRAPGFQTRASRTLRQYISVKQKKKRGAEEEQESTSRHKRVQTIKESIIMVAVSWGEGACWIFLRWQKCSVTWLTQEYAVVKIHQMGGFGSVYFIECKLCLNKLSALKKKRKTTKNPTLLWSGG